MEEIEGAWERVLMVDGVVANIKNDKSQAANSNDRLTLNLALEWQAASFPFLHFLHIPCPELWYSTYCELLIYFRSKKIRSMVWQYKMALKQ